MAGENTANERTTLSITWTAGSGRYYVDQSIGLLVSCCTARSRLLICLPPTCAARGLNGRIPRITPIRRVPLCSRRRRESCARWLAGR